MPSYVLNYFPIGGRAELSRLLFAVGGVEYTNNQYTFEKWASLKSDSVRFPLSQMPTLEVDETVICQSHTITRYLANELKLYGANGMERAVIDQICDTLGDVIEGMTKIAFNKDISDKAGAFNTHFEDEKTKKALTFVQSFIKGQFTLGDEICMADLLIFILHEKVGEINPDAMKAYKELDALANAVGKVDKVKSHVDARQYIKFP